MAVDFFQRQDEARQRTTRFLFLFALGILTLIGLIYGLAAYLFLYLGADPRRPIELWDPSLFMTVVGGVLVVVTGGSLMKAAQLSSGGKAVALMLDGREVLGTTTDLKERRLLNVVEEMAIAAGLPVPPVYILPEAGINAFAAGHSPGDAVVAVSQGCLEYLTRDELQGVVGHEFSHILNGDVRLSLRIVTIVFGILAISQIGFVIMRWAPISRSSSDNKGNGAYVLLGLGLYLLGMGGAFFGWLIQAAVSRQREFLADASAVQFTRNPDGIAGALKKIGGLAQGSRIANPHAGEVSHMFLSDAFMGARLNDMLATHPPLVERIRRLDPQFDGVFPEVAPVGVAVEEAKGPQKGRIPPLIPGLPRIPGLPQVGGLPAAALAAEAAPQHVGKLEPEHVTYAADLQSGLSPVLREAAQQPFSARAVVYAVLLDPRPDVRQVQLEQLRKCAPQRDYEETLRLLEPVRSLPDEARLPLIDQALPALRQMSPPQHQDFRSQVEGLIHADNQVSIFEYALHCVLTRYLDADYNRQRPVVRYNSAAQITLPMTTTLSLLAWVGHDNAAASQAAFAAGMTTFLGRDAQGEPLRPRAECQLQPFHAALQALAQSTPELKRRIIAACAATILYDHQVTIREGELLRAICATLGCPMPPLLENQETTADQAVAPAGQA
jgi:Zn-dependent protease with chaperone function